MGTGGNEKVRGTWFCYLFGALFLRALPIIFGLSLLGAVATSQHGALLRCGIAILAGLLTYFDRRSAYLLLIASVPCLELIGLLVEPEAGIFYTSAIVGLLVIRASEREESRQSSLDQVTSAIRELMGHPFFLILLYSVSFGFFALLIAIGELRALAFERISPVRVIGWGLSSWFDSEPAASNKALGLVITGAIHLCWMIRLACDWRILNCKRRMIIWMLILGSMPTLVLAVAQVFFPQLLGSLHAGRHWVLHSGSFLGFYSGLVVLLCVQALLIKGLVRWQGILVWLVLLVSFSSLALSLAKVSWGSLLCAVAPLIIVSMVAAIKLRKMAPLTVAVALLLCGVGVPLVIAIQANSLQESEFCQSHPICGKFAEFAAALADWRSLVQQLEKGERASQIQLARSLISDFPVTGRGPGGFVARTPWFAGGRTEAHPWILEMASDFGWVILAVVIIGVVLLMVRLTKKFSDCVDFRDYLLVGLNFTTVCFVFLALALDNYFSCYALNFILITWFFAVTYRDSFIKKNPLWFLQRRLTASIILLAIALGLSTAANPLTIPVLGAGPFEEQEEGSAAPALRSGPLFTAPWLAGQCARLMIRPAMKQDVSAIRIGIRQTNAALAPGLTLDQIPGLEKALLLETKRILVSGEWNAICLCVSSNASGIIDQKCSGDDQTCSLYLAAPYGRFGSWTKGDNPNAMSAFLSFAVSGLEMVSHEEVYGKPWLDGSCSDYIDLGKSNQ